MRDFGAGTAYEPYATSLRMSDVGYRNRNQAGLEVSVNSLEEYVRDLTRAITTPHPPYEALGVVVNGEYRQLNANILQIENEYYSFIRPKRVARSGERPTKALRRAGVEYVEVRALDVSAFDPVGVNQNKLRFLEAFLALCLMKDSPPIERAEHGVLDQNHITVARCGREPGLTLSRDGREAPMLEWARELLDSMSGICDVLDRGDPARPYSQALATQSAKVEDVALTPSARHDGRADGWGVVLRPRAAHVGDAQGIFPRALSSQRGAPARVLPGSRGVPGGAAQDRDCRSGNVRRVSGALFRGLTAACVKFVQLPLTLVIILT